MLLLNVQRDIVWITAPAALFVIAIGSRVLRPRSCRGQSTMCLHGHCASAARILRGVLHVTQRNLLSTVRSSPTPLCFGSTRVHSRHRRLSWQKSWFQKLVTTHQKNLRRKKGSPAALASLEGGPAPAMVAPRVTSRDIASAGSVGKFITALLDEVCSRITQHTHARQRPRTSAHAHTHAQPSQRP